ncbi:hypothetical protein K4S27_11085 [Staphylococcus epidermidis]|nr:hypothetical protein [Staphylococcus epidermidis]MCG2360221.1 hypothetical protein [Staphylococcus epidermidis]MCG2367175.1 hypothetical protein [Staphylococcus epidermidis]
MSITTIVNGYLGSMNQSLKENNYFSALVVAMVLPDICSSIEYSKEGKVGVRYKKWVRKYFIPFTKNYEESFIKYLNETNLYAMRCSLLHQGSSNPSKQKGYNMKNKSLRVDDLLPMVNYANEDKIFPVEAHEIGNKKLYHHYFVDIHFLCELIEFATKKWLDESNKLNNDYHNLFNIAYAYKDKKDKEKISIYKKG